MNINIKLLYYLAPSLVIGFLTSLVWVTLLTLVISAIFALLFSNIIIVQKLKQRRVLLNMILIIGVAFFSILIRVLVFIVCEISSYSMENTLFEGDKIFVSKLRYGPKLPQSLEEIPWINIFPFSKKKQVSTSNPNLNQYRRLKGLSTIKRGDVVVLSYPNINRNSELYIKRCFAIPTDTIKIINGFLALNYAGYSKVTDINANTSSIMEDTINRFKTSNQYLVIPQNKHFSWVVGKFEYLIVPKKGMTINLDYQNFVIYNKIIQDYEMKKIEYFDSTVYINDINSRTYTFQNNYYFVIGDNHLSSIDSRSFGFQPEFNIEGFASLIIFSNNGTKIRWSRVLKKII